MSSFDLDTNQKKYSENINFEAFYRNFACHVSRHPCRNVEMSNVDVFEKGDISIVWGAGTANSNFLNFQNGYISVIWC